MKTTWKVVLLLSLVSVVYAADDVVTAVRGTVDKVDAAGKTVVVKTADGTKYSLRLVETTTVHGADASASGAKDSWHGIEKGSEVVVHYSKRGAEETAVEIDRIGKDGLQATKGTVKAMDRGGKKIVVVTENGTEETFHLTGHATTDAGKDIAHGAEKGSKVVIYSSEDAGKRVAHFFEKI